jgi:hypothetical protein
MWTIRQEQMDAFRQSALQQFEDEMLDHLREFAPKHWNVMGELDGRRVIRTGIERAEKYGFTNRGPVRFYIELMLMFGSYFDTDPQYPWASSILRQREPMNQMIRADQLHAAMKDYVELVSGPDHRYSIAAMRRLSQTRFEDVLEGVTRGKLNLEASVLHQLERIYPEKCAYLGEPCLRILIQRGFALSLRYDLVSEKGMVLMTALIFALGDGFAHDPQCVWISRRLDDTRWSDTGKRVEELYSRAMIYLQHVLREGGRR